MPLRSIFVFCALVVGLAASATTAHADIRAYAETGDPEASGLELLQEDAHDLVYFTEASGGGWVKVRPLPFPGRKIPEEKGGVLVVEVLSIEARKFAVRWEDILKIDLWEIRLERETKDRIAGQDFVGAYPYLSILQRDFQSRPGLRQLRIDFLWQDAIARAKKGELSQTLAILEELRRYAPEYEPARVRQAMSGTADQLMAQLLKQNKRELAENLLARLEEQYVNDRLPAIKKWRDEFLRQAQEKKQQAEEAFEKKEYRTARKLSREAAELMPELPGVLELVAKIEKAFPMANIGVLQASSVLDPIRIDNWAARRSGRLVYRTVFEIKGPGPRGGEYDFIFGDVEVSPDQQNLSLILSPDDVQPPLDKISAEYLADIMAARAQRNHNSYFAPWAAAVSGIAINDPKQISFNLRRPNVLPVCLLQIPVDGSWFGDEPGSPTGDYRLESQDEQEVRFVLRGAPRTATQPREIVERYLESGSEGVSLLLKGDIDVCDQLFPADAKRLQGVPNIKVAAYPLPTVHMLVPCSDHTYLADRVFRRALVYGINREDILKGELLGGNEVKGCQVLSGPFPAGRDQSDSLGYAYDPNIKPLPFEPPLAKLLVELAKNQMGELAKRKKEEAPTLEPIRLAFPDDSLSRSACEAISSQWKLIGLEVELVPLPTGVTFPDKEKNIADLVYVSAAVWEPVIDARRILGPEGLAASNDQLVGLGLRRLEGAVNWKEVHDRLMDLHQISFNELPILPLWQMVESYAYRSDLYGVGQDIVTLYQNADQWNIGK
jgi:ABC-type transport system substrate-binding protein